MTDTPPPTDPAGQTRTVLLAFLAIVLVSVAQLLLNSLPPNDTSLVPLSLILVVAGVGLFLWGRAAPVTPLEQRLFSHVRISGKAALIASAVLLSVVATLTTLLLMKMGRATFMPVLTLWLGAGLCYVAAFLPALPGLPARADVRRWWSEHWKEIAAVGAITAVAAAMRFYMLGSLPRVINGDEGWIGRMAQSTAVLPYANPFALWENFGGLYLQAINTAFSIFGPTTFALRLLPAIAGTLAIPASYLLGREIGGRRLGILAAIFIAISHTHINFSRTVGVGYIQDTWLVPLELYLLLSALKRNSAWRAALAGVLLGVHFSVYLTPQIFTAMLAVFSVLFVLFFRKRYPGAARLLPVFWIGLAVTLLPEAVYAARYPDLFFTRLNDDGTFQSGWLAAKMAETGQGPILILAERVQHAFLSLIYYPAIDFYGSQIPMLTLFTAALFLIGLGVALWKTRRLEFLLLNGYFWTGLLAIGIFSVPESADSYRLLMVLPAVMILAAVGLDEALTSLGLGWDRRRLAYAAVAGFLFLNLFTFNRWVYFVDMAGNCRYGGDSQTRFASYLGKYLATLRRESTVYLLRDDVYWYGTHASTDFLSLGMPVTNVADGIDTIPLVSGDVIIASPNRLEELTTWAHDHPGGRLDAQFDCNNEFLLAYTVP